MPASHAASDERGFVVTGRGRTRYGWCRVESALGSQGQSWSQPLSQDSVRELTNRQDLWRIKECVLRAGRAPGAEVWAQELERGDSRQPRAGGPEEGR